MLRRLTISLLVLFVLALLVIPLALGFVLERLYPDLAASANQAWTGGDLQLTRFDRGWFVSFAHGELTIPGQAPVAWHDAVSHGPFPWTASSAAPAWVSGRLRPEPSPALEGELSYRVNLDTSVSTRVELARAGTDAAGPAAGPTTLTTHIEERGEQVVLDWQSEQLNVLGQMSGAAATGSLTRLESGFWAVDLESRVSSLALAALPLTAAKELGVKLNTTAAGALATLEFDVSFGSATVQDVVYTSGTGLVTLAKVDEAALARLLRRLRQGGDKATRNAAFMGELIAQIPILIGREPHLVVENLAAETDHGPVSGSVDLTLVDADSRLAVEPIYLLAFLQGTVALELPTALARQSIETRVRRAVPEIAENPEWVQAAVNDQYDRLISDGLFVQRGATLSTRVEFRDGAAVINGKTVPLPTPPPQ